MTVQFACVQLATRCQNAQCDGQIKSPGILGQVGRGKVDSYPLVAWKLKPRVLNR